MGLWSFELLWRRRLAASVLSFPGALLASFNARSPPLCSLCPFHMRPARCFLASGPKQQLSHLFQVTQIKIHSAMHRVTLRAPAVLGAIFHMAPAVRASLMGPPRIDSETAVVAGGRICAGASWQTSRENDSEPLASILPVSGAVMSTAIREIESAEHCG